MVKVIARLTLLAAICGLLLSLANVNTAEQIERNRSDFAARQLLEVAGHTGDILQVAPNRYVLMTDNGPSGFIFGVDTRDGYNGHIGLWLGTSLDGTVLGVRVKSHQETPGLGDKIEARVAPWIFVFNGKRRGDTDWDVRKYGGDFDQFTGATITPRAVVKAIDKGLATFETNKAQWLGELNDEI